MKIQIFQKNELDIHSGDNIVEFSIIVDGEQGSLERKIYDGSIHITNEMTMTSSEIPRVCMTENALRVFKQFYLENFLSETT